MDMENPPRNSDLASEMSEYGHQYAPVPTSTHQYLPVPASTHQ